jgi:hypothetical protein
VRDPQSSVLPTAITSASLPFALFFGFLVVSRMWVRALNGAGDYPVLFLCTVLGALPLLRLNASLGFRIGLVLAYVVVMGTLLMMFGFWVDCRLFHDCD